MTLIAGIALLGNSNETLAEKLDKKTWVKSFKQLFPKEICKSYSNIFITPYGIKTADCEKIARKALNYCLDINNRLIPASLEMPKDGAKWGTILGECSGASYSAAMKARIKT